MATTKQSMANEPIPVGVVSKRTHGILSRRVTTLGVLFALTEEEFLRIPGINKSSLKEVESYFRKLGEVKFFSSKWSREKRLKAVFGEVIKAPTSFLEVVGAIDSTQRSELKELGVTTYDDFRRVTYTQLKNLEYGGKPLFTTEQLNKLVKELKATGVKL